jgi:predicted heme/steroid binding protein
MAPPAAELSPPKDDPFTPAQLAQHDGSDPTKPILLAIKGTVFDVTAKRAMYGPGAGYNVFAGKDGSVGLGEFVFISVALEVGRWWGPFDFLAGWGGLLLCLETREFPIALRREQEDHAVRCGVFR